MKQNIRWIIYISIGIAFGVADYYIETTARQFLTYPLLLFVGLTWIILSALVALYEIRKSSSKKRAILASALVLVVGVTVYYVFYALILVLDSRVATYPWSDNLLDIVFWGAAAVIGGAAIGFFTATFYRFLLKRKLT